MGTAEALVVAVVVLRSSQYCSPYISKLTCVHWGGLTWFAVGITDEETEPVDDAEALTVTVVVLRSS